MKRGQARKIYLGLKPYGLKMMLVKGSLQTHGKRELMECLCPTLPLEWCLLSEISILEQDKIWKRIKQAREHLQHVQNIDPYYASLDIH